MNEERYLRRPEVEAMTGLSRSSIYRLMSEDMFVRPYRLGKAAVRWRLSDVEQWLAGRALTAKDRLSKKITGLIGTLKKDETNARKYARCCSTRL